MSTDSVQNVCAPVARPFRVGQILQCFKFMCARVRVVGIEPRRDRADPQRWTGDFRVRLQPVALARVQGDAPAAHAFEDRGAARNVVYHPRRDAHWLVPAGARAGCLLRAHPRLSEAMNELAEHARGLFAARSALFAHLDLILCTRVRAWLRLAKCTELSTPVAHHLNVFEGQFFTKVVLCSRDAPLDDSAAQSARVIELLHLGVPKPTPQSSTVTATVTVTAAATATEPGASAPADPCRALQRDAFLHFLALELRALGHWRGLKIDMCGFKSRLREDGTPAAPACTAPSASAAPCAQPPALENPLLGALWFESAFRDSTPRENLGRIAAHMEALGFRAPGGAQHICTTSDTDGASVSCAGAAPVQYPKRALVRALPPILESAEPATPRARSENAEDKRDDRHDDSDETQGRPASPPPPKRIKV